MEHVKKGTWVQVHEIVLKPEERLNTLPEDTRVNPLEMWVKGFLNSDGYIRSTVEITTVTGRVVSGKLTAVNPRFEHNFGECIPELVSIGPKLRDMLKEGEMDER